MTVHTCWNALCTQYELLMCSARERIEQAMEYIEQKPEWKQMQHEDFEPSRARAFLDGHAELMGMMQGFDLALHLFRFRLGPKALEELVQEHLEVPAPPSTTFETKENA